MCHFSFCISFLITISVLLFKNLLMIHPALVNALSLQQPLKWFTLKTCKSCLFKRKLLHPHGCVPFSAPTIIKPSFSIVPFDNTNGPSTCPAHLLHKSEDGSASPIELVEEAFDLFRGTAFKYVFCVPCFLLSTHSFST